jgi:hypothetical protein
MTDGAKDTIVAVCTVVAWVSFIAFWVVILTL